MSDTGSNSGLSSIDSSRPIVMVGGGKMGGALMQGWLASGLKPQSLFLIEPNEAARESWHAQDVAVFPSLAAVPAGLRPSVIVLAVKPQIMSTIMADLRRFTGGRATLFLSIAAGRDLRFFAEGLGDAVPVVRAMPNTPALIGQGATAACANHLATDAHRSLATALLRAVGILEWLDDEALLDVVTSLSGSGPAYVFLLTEALTKAGIAAGLSPDLSARLSRATVAGAGSLLAQSTDDPAQLRKNVTSPGGTTERALQVLMSEAGIEALLIRAVAAGAARSRELAQA